MNRRRFLATSVPAVTASLGLAGTLCIFERPPVPEAGVPAPKLATGAGPCGIAIIDLANDVS